MVLQYICFVLSEFWAFPPISVLVIIMEDMTVKSAIHNALYCHNVMLLLQVLLLTAKSNCLTVLCFYPKAGFFGPRTAKSQPICIKFCTHLLLYEIHLWADFDRDRRVGGSRSNRNDYVFYPRDVVSAVYATATWLGGCLSVTAGIASKQLNLS